MISYEVKKTNSLSGNCVLIEKKDRKITQRIYFTYDPNEYNGQGGITNSLRKNFPISREKVSAMAGKLFKKNNLDKYIMVDALKNAVNAFYAGAVDFVYLNGKVLLSRD